MLQWSSERAYIFILGITTNINSDLSLKPAGDFPNYKHKTKEILFCTLLCSVVHSTLVKSIFSEWLREKQSLKCSHEEDTAKFQVLLNPGEAAVIGVEPIGNIPQIRAVKAFQSQQASSQRSRVSTISESVESNPVKNHSKHQASSFTFKHPHAFQKISFLLFLWFTFLISFPLY